MLPSTFSRLMMLKNMKNIFSGLRWCINILETLKLVPNSTNFSNFHRNDTSKAHLRAFVDYWGSNCFWVSRQ